jgi:hypothetical protein
MNDPNDKKVLWIQQAGTFCERKSHSALTAGALVLHPNGEPDRAQHHDDRKYTEHECFHCRSPYPRMLSNTQDDSGNVIKTAEYSYQI